MTVEVIAWALSPVTTRESIFDRTHRRRANRRRRRATRDHGRARAMTPARAVVDETSSSGEDARARAGLERALGFTDGREALESDSPGVGRRARSRRSRRSGAQTDAAFDEEAWIGTFGVVKRSAGIGKTVPRRAGDAERRAESGSGRIGLETSTGVNACEVLIKERVTAIEGTFRSQGSCLAQLMGRLRARQETHASRAPAPSRKVAAALLGDRDDAEEILAFGDKIGVDDPEGWLEFAAYVKYNAVTRTSRPAARSPNGVGDSAGYVQCSMVMFDAISACNHSCDPNAEVSAISDQGEVTLYSLRPIAAGEEITICYGKPSLRWLPARCRRRSLLKEWHFECQCEKCEAEIRSGLAVHKPMSKPWDIHDPRWFYCTHDYTTGFETHFDAEGNLLALSSKPRVIRNGSLSEMGDSTSGSRTDLVSEEFGNKLRLGSASVLGDDDYSSSGFSSLGISGVVTSSSDSAVTINEDEHVTSGGSEDEEVMRWHERWRKQRMKTYSVKNVGVYTPLQLYRAMQRCQIRQDHWQFLVVRDALITQIISDAATRGGTAQRQACPTLSAETNMNGKLLAFKLVLNHCRSLVRIVPNSSNFVERFITLENMIYWHSTEGTWYRQRRHARAGDRKKSPKGVDVEFFDLPERSRWLFRLQNIRDAAHADVLAWNTTFCKSPAAPF